MCFGYGEKEKEKTGRLIGSPKATKEKGLAEAAVTAAKYKALGQNKDIYLAEIQRDIATAVYTNLKDFKIEMPHNYVGGGDGSGKMTSNLDVITGFAALSTMQNAMKKNASAASTFFG